MKKLYFIIPLVLAGIFFFFYTNEKDRINADIKAKQQQLDQEHAERLRKQEEDRENARKVAAVQATKRAEEREAKRAAEDEQKAVFQKAQDSLANAKQERERVYKQKLKLDEDRTAAQDQLRRAREQFKLMQVQSDYVKNSVKEASDKKSLYQQALNKLTAAEQLAQTNEDARRANQGKKS